MANDGPGQGKLFLTSKSHGRGTRGQKYQLERRINLKYVQSTVEYKKKSIQLHCGMVEKTQKKLHKAATLTCK